MNTRWLGVAGVSMALGAAACGTVGEGDGGAEVLPSRRIDGFAKVTSEERTSVLPFVLYDSDDSILEASALAIGSDARVFFQRQPEDGGAARIQSSLCTLAVTCTEPQDVFMAESDWEEGWVGAPSIMRFQGDAWMYYLGGITAPAIGLARSSDDGATWTREADPIFVAESGERLGSADAVVIGGLFYLFYTTGPEVLTDDPWPSSIALATSSDGLSWARQGTVLSPGTGCFTPEGEETLCWDGVHVGAPDVRFSRSPTGRDLYDLWYEGGTGRSSDTGFAASFDGRTFTRYRLNPLFEDGESSPTILELGLRLVLYFTDRLDDRPAVGVAINEPR